MRSSNEFIPVVAVHRAAHVHWVVLVCSGSGMVPVLCNGWNYMPTLLHRCPHPNSS